MPKISEVLGRRTDLSTFVVHLTKKTAQSARLNLRSMLREQRIRAVTAMGAAASRLEKGSRDWNSQRVVSFTETPLEELSAFFVEVEEKRRTNFLPYGLAFTKMRARRRGITPVWYTVAERGEDWRMKYAWSLIEEAKAESDFANSDIAQLAPFFDIMGYLGPGKRKEFWWEREWRHLGTFRFQFDEVALCLCPEDRIDEFEAFMRRLARGRNDPSAAELRFVDPRWGLERIIASLAGLLSTDLTPFDA